MPARLFRSADYPTMGLPRSPRDLSGKIRGENKIQERRRPRRCYFRPRQWSPRPGRSHKRYFRISRCLWARSSELNTNGRYTLGSQERRPVLHPRSKLCPIARLDRDAKTPDHVGLARRPRYGHESANEHRSLLLCAIARVIPNKTERSITRRSGSASDSWDLQLGIHLLYGTHHARHRCNRIGVFEAQ